MVLNTFRCAMKVSPCSLELMEKIKSVSEGNVNRSSFKGESEGNSPLYPCFSICSSHLYAYFVHSDSLKYMCKETRLLCNAFIVVSLWVYREFTCSVRMCEIMTFALVACFERPVCTDVRVRKDAQHLPLQSKLKDLFWKYFQVRKQLDMLKDLNSSFLIWLLMYTLPSSFFLHKMWMLCL